VSRGSHRRRGYDRRVAEQPEVPELSDDALSEVRTLNQLVAAFHEHAEERGTMQVYAATEVAPPLP